jgi:hypothetical protein
MSDARLNHNWFGFDMRFSGAESFLGAREQLAADDSRASQPGKPA